MISYIFSSILLPLVLALIMFGMGLSLSVKDFENIFRYPKAIIVGLTLQMLILPIVAFLIAWSSPLSPEFKVGLIIIAACPGGTVSNLITYLFRGNVALSISLTTVNSLLTIFTVPLIVNIALNFFIGSSSEINLPFGNTFWQIFIITLFPCALGILINYYFPNFSENIRKPLNYIMPTALGLVMLGTIYFSQKTEVSLSFEDYLWISPFAFLLNISGMLIGYYTAKNLKLRKENRFTIAVEVGLQNTGLALNVASNAKLLNNPLMAAPASVYALFTFFTAVGIGFIFGDWKSKKSQDSKS